MTRFWTLQTLPAIATSKCASSSTCPLTVGGRAEGHRVLLQSRHGRSLSLPPFAAHAFLSPPLYHHASSVGLGFSFSATFCALVLFHINLPLASSPSPSPSRAHFQFSRRFRQPMEFRSLCFLPGHAGDGPQPPPAPEAGRRTQRHCQGKQRGRGCLASHHFVICAHDAMPTDAEFSLCPCDAHPPALAADLADPWSCWALGLHHVNERPLLWIVQPCAADHRWQPEGASEANPGG